MTAQGNIAAVVLCGLLATACNTTSDGSAVDPASANQGGLQKTSYTSGAGETFLIEYRWRGLTRSYGVDIRRPANPLPATGPATDRLVQNTLRDFFSSRVCSQGFFGGVIKLAYLRDDRWGAELKCTTKRQANI